MRLSSMLIWPAVWLFSLTFCSARAQGPVTGTLSGQVQYKPGEAAAAASVAVLRASDSMMVMGCVADTAGHYIFRQVPPGRYIIAVTMAGSVKKFFSAPFAIDKDHPVMVVPVIYTGQNRQQLQTVEVMAQKPFIQQLADRTVLHVENSIVSRGGTALDVLQLAPGVSIDPQNNTISLRGRNGVMVMIDNKPTYLSTQQVFALLQNMPANSIQSIELITNPSAKYDAAGSAGIINIRLKRNSQLKGTNGSISASPAQGTYPKLSTGITLNHRSGNWNLYSTYNYDYREYYINMHTQRVFKEANMDTTLQTLGYWHKWDRGHTFKAGADYYLGTKSLLGVMVNASFGNNDALLTNNNLFYQGNDPIRQSAYINASGQASDRIAANLNFKHTFAAEQNGVALHELAIDIDYARTHIRPGDRMTTVTDTDVLNQRNTYPSNVIIRSTKLDYIRPLKKLAKLEAGIKTSHITSRNDARFGQQINGAWAIDSGRTDYFKYAETIHAAYLNGNKGWKQWTVQAGVRMEYTRSAAHSITTQQRTVRHYLNLFPSVFIVRRLGKNHQLGLSYSRRIDRPNYQDLNPFVYIIDPWSVYAGNPYLQPQYTHSIQATYSYRNQLSLNLAYNHTGQYIQVLRRRDTATNTLTVMPVNWGRYNNWNLSMSMPLTVTKWWSMRQTMDLFYNKYGTVHMGDHLQFDKLTLSLKMNQTFVLAPGFTAELSGIYNSPRVIDVLIDKGFWQVSAGLQKSLWKNTATIGLNGSDIFHSFRFRGRVDYGHTQMRIHNYVDSRVIRLNVSYKFGNNNLKAARLRRTGAEDEQRRVGNSNN